MPVSTNFDHLREVDPGLAAVGGFAERYFVEDPNTALIKTRQFVERLAILIAERVGIERSPGENLNDLLRRLKVEDAAPRDVLDVIHRVRKDGNAAVHDFHDERRAAFDAIKLCHRLGVWFRAAATGNPKLSMAFSPPRPNADDREDFKEEIARLRARLAAAETDAERLKREAAEAAEARLTAEARAVSAEEERRIYEELAEEAERRALAPPTPEARTRFVAAAFASARDIDFDEADTRLLIDEQLRNSGWDADSVAIRYAAGARPVRGRNLAIAEWPTATGPADYALFIGTKLVGVVEAKRRNKDVSSSLGQADRYAQGPDGSDSFEFAGGPWDGRRVPFLFSTNGRGFYPQFRTQSGIWFRDARRRSNAARPLEAWPTPAGLSEQLDVDLEAAEAALRKREFDFGFDLRPYQVAAIRKVEEALETGRREMLVAMATGTGKTKLSIAMVYRLLEAKRFLRVCFVVDRSALGEQAETAFETTRMVDSKTFAEIFGLRGLSEREIDRDAKIHICTVQSLVQRVLMRDAAERPPIDQYDLIIIDECHRGYLLDRAMSDAEMTFRDQEDYVSKYRRVVEYFDAVKIGLTATPALHTAQIFGEPIYRYSYREAVVDGWLVDHDPPQVIRTALGAAGITFEKGETIDALDTRTGEIDTATLEDRLAFSVEHFNRKVIAPAFNRVVSEELARRIDIMHPKAGKTLIFAASDRHADAVVDQLRVAYRAEGVPIADDMILKITGSVDQVSKLILKFKNEDDPRVAVTVDLLTTGIDVPRITNLVFLRRVNSRILYDQMIGRATRLCGEIGKEVFQIYDAVDLYPHLEKLTEMRPVVVDPKVSFETLFDGFEGASDASHAEEILDQIIVKLARKIRKMGAELRAQYEAQAGETPEATLQRFRGGPATAVRDWTRERPGLGRFFDFEGQRGAPPIIPIFKGEDRVTAVEPGYGAGQKPEDFIEAFSLFVRENRNRIAALQIVLTRPRDLTRESLRELKLALDQRSFTEPALRAAWRSRTNHDVAASIVGFVRQAALGEPLTPYAERVDRAIRAIAARHGFDQVQRKWLDRIGAEVKSRTVVDRAALDEAPFSVEGGFRRIDRVFNGEAEAILREIAAETWEPAA